MHKSVVLGDLEDIICLIDDMLIYGQTQEKYKVWLAEILTRLCKSGLSLGRKSVRFSK